MKPEVLWRIQWYVFYRSLSENALFDIWVKHMLELLKAEWKKADEAKKIVKEHKTDIENIVKSIWEEWGRWVKKNIEILVAEILNAWAMDLENELEQAKNDFLNWDWDVETMNRDIEI